ncbi:MAG: hypothetical protein N3G74_00685 [Candidatus Micrarchaeota archaeon]|nr:hypothetical protein [Candidatus Micrarchaeota archaeon]
MAEMFKEKKDIKKDAKREVRKRLDIIKSVLTLIKGKLAPAEYTHVKRLMADGIERDIIFVQGLSTGIELAALNADDLKIIIKIFKNAKNRGKDGKPVFEDKEIRTIDEILENRFPLVARRKMIAVIKRADNLLLDSLIGTLEKVLK